MPKGFFAKKLSLACMIVSLVMLIAFTMSGTKELGLIPAMGTIFAGSLVAFAISEQNPREE